MLFIDRERFTASDPQTARHVRHGVVPTQVNQTFTTVDESWRGARTQCFNKSRSFNSPPRRRQDDSGALSSQRMHLVGRCRAAAAEQSAGRRDADACSKRLGLGQSATRRPLDPAFVVVVGITRRPAAGPRCPRVGRAMRRTRWPHDRAGRTVRREGCAL